MKLFIILLSLFSLNGLAVDFFSVRPVTCTESLSNFTRVPISENKKTGFGHRSLSKSFDSYIDFRNTMLELRPSIDNFLKRRAREGTIKKVTFGEVVNFYFDSHQKLINHLESGLGISSEVDSYLLTLINGISMPARKYQAFELLQENKKLLKKRYNLKDPRQGKFINSLAVNQYKGLLGEFDIAMRFNDIVGQSFKVSHDFYENEHLNSFKFLFTKRMTKAFKKVSSYSNRALQRKYPKIFRADSNLSRKEFLAQAKSFILAKEFDLISHKDGRFQILEVKNLKEALSLKHIDVEIKKKTVLDQAIEDIQILEFLELEDSVDFSVVLLRGVTNKAAKRFNHEGINVVTDLIIEE